MLLLYLFASICLDLICVCVRVCWRSQFSITSISSCTFWGAWRTAYDSGGRSESHNRLCVADNKSRRSVHADRCPCEEHVDATGCDDLSTVPRRHPAVSCPSWFEARVGRGLSSYSRPTRGRRCLLDYLLDPLHSRPGELWCPVPALPGRAEPAPKWRSDWRRFSPLDRRRSVEARLLRSERTPRERWHWLR